MIFNTLGNGDADSLWNLCSMIVCHCMRVNDRQIRMTVESGATTVAQVARTLGAGSCCGGCAPLVAELVMRHRPLPVLRRASPSELAGEVAAEVAAE
jgi:bacterioferritin-associated ferredoxin